MVILHPRAGGSGGSGRRNWQRLQIDGQGREGCIQYQPVDGSDNHMSITLNRKDTTCRKNWAENKKPYKKKMAQKTRSQSLVLHLLLLRLAVTARLKHSEKVLHSGTSHENSPSR
jgi:hypothetical protein